MPFCLQSCVKPLEYAVAVDVLGTQHVHRFVGKEPSGLRFNTLSLNEESKCATMCVFEGQVNIFYVHVFITEPQTSKF